MPSDVNNGPPLDPGLTGAVVCIILGSFGNAAIVPVSRCPLTNPSLKEFKEAEGTEPEIAADVIDLVKTFQQIMDRLRTRPIIQVDEETVTVGQMIEYMHRRLAIEDRPIRLKQLLRHK